MKIINVDIAKQDKDFTLKDIGIKTRRFGIFKKSTRQVIKEISKKWTKLSDEEQEKITKYMLGI